MMVGLLSNTPPFSSIIVQHLEGGFMCIVPPGSPLVTRESGDVAVAVHMFLANDSPAELAAPDSSTVEVLYKWPKAEVPQGSTFSISKVPRVRKGKLIQNGGYMVTYHMTVADSHVQLVAFNRATVMDRLQRWLTTKPSEEVREVLVSLTGMRVNSDMDERGDTVFMMDVQPASQVSDFSGLCPFVARSMDPQMAIGVVDKDVVGYLAEELGADLRGEFAARVENRILEFGPRVDDDQPGYFGTPEIPFGQE